MTDSKDILTELLDAQRCVNEIPAPDDLPQRAHDEIKRLREGLRALCHEAWGYADLDGGDIQDKLASLGILVEVPASDDIREEYGCDTMYTVAWSEAALEESRDD